MNHCCHKPCPPEPAPPESINFYAQYGAYSNDAAGTDINFFPVFQEGSEIQLENDTTILLSPGYLYLIDFIFLATPGASGYMQILPFINGTPRLLYSFFAPAGAEKNTSASGSFTTNEALASEARLTFRLSYSSSTGNIDLSGAVSVTPLQAVRPSL
ncbi:hypothetical protein [Anaerostipes sp.]|uniref:hypothetical protein n=1 Tax=Anaerostipes sp. TaxID=1872530 RepID=UPI0025C62F85|nr:hypothetical protein [Anaerostipes sp.]MBS7009400.1 hypothetical protein [Anaerostipes sp.]